VLMSYQDKYLSYVRGKRAGETRLVGHRSIGNRRPHKYRLMLIIVLCLPTYTIIILPPLSVEVAEEVSVETSHTDRVVALLNDESNEVGSVHLGIVHHWVLDAPNVSRREQMITQMAFMRPAELHEVRDTLETWSGLCLSRLTEMTRTLS